MKKIALLFLLVCSLAHSQLWSGVLSSSRATNWTNAGVVGGVPSATWTQSGSTIAACGTSGSPVSPSACGITAAISGAANNTYVLLGPGTFYLNACISIERSNIAVRGLGANQTFLVFSSSSCVNGIACGFCIVSSDVNYKGSMSNGPVTVTAANYNQGQTTFTFPSVTNLVIGNPVIFDQQDSSTDNGGPFIGQSTATGTFTSPGLAGPYSVDGNTTGAQVCASTTTYVGCYSQEQIVTVAGCDGVTTFGHACTNAAQSVIISPGLNAPTWASGMRAWWATHPPQNDGIENLSIDTSAVATSGTVNVEFFNAVNSWTSGIASVWPQRSHIQLQYAANITNQNDYFFNTQVQNATSYGIEHYESSESLDVNNIFHGVTTPHICSGCSGNVFAYNFTVNSFYTGSSGYNIPAVGDHAIEDTSLYEGNVTNGMTADAIHGTGNFMTNFRNYYSGPSPVCWQSSSNTSTPQLTYSTATYAACTNNRQPINMFAFHRGYNNIGNVLGSSADTTYQSCSTDLTIYFMGCGNAGVPSDSNVLATAMLWGNVDGFHGFTSPQFNSAEVPSTLTGTQAVFANPVPSSQTLPASFVYSSKPSWWPATKPWPIIGPDVTGGNVANVNGTVYTNPAEDCYLNVLGGNANGEEGVLSFNASTCYATATSATFSGTFAGSQFN